MRVGNLVVDKLTGMRGIIIEQDVTFIGQGYYADSGVSQVFDWSVLFDCGSVIGVMSEDLEVVSGET